MFLQKARKTVQFKFRNRISWVDGVVPKFMSFENKIK